MWRPTDLLDKSVKRGELLFVESKIFGPPLRSSLLRRCAIPVKSGMKRRYTLQRPRKDLRTDPLVGGFASFREFVGVSSISSRLGLIVCPMYVMDVFVNIF